MFFGVIKINLLIFIFTIMICLQFGFGLNIMDCQLIYIIQCGCLVQGVTPSL